MFNLKRNCIAITFILTGITSHAQKDCKLQKDLDSIKVYTCHTDTSRFKSIVAEFTLRTTIEQLTQLILNVPNLTKWQYNTIEAQTIKEISSSEQIYYTVIEAPWPVTDRDMVVRIKTKHDRNNRSLIITTESEAEALPKKVGYVRVPSSHAKWIVTQKNKNQLQIKYTMQIDPGGSVPAWLVNWVCAEAPYRSFKNLKAILEMKK